MIDQKSSNSAPPETGPVLNILLVDDCPFIRGAWEQMNGAQVSVETAATPTDAKAFVTNFMAYSSKIEELIIITDLHFDGTEASGRDLAERLKESGFSGEVYLASNVESNESSLGQNSPFSGNLPKFPEEALDLLSQWRRQAK